MRAIPPVLWLVVVLGSLMGCSSGKPTDAMLSVTDCGNPAPLLRSAPDSMLIPNQYIIVYRYDEVQDPDALTNELAQRYDFTPILRYTIALKGFLANLTPEVVQALRCEPNIDYIEHDTKAETDGS